jgi:hypothetical protein
LKSQAITRGYVICNVYYSDDNGDIIKEKITTIETTHRSYAMRIKNY